MPKTEKKPAEPEFDGAAEAEEAGAGLPRRRRTLLLGGSVLSVVAIGALSAMLAVPGREKIPLFDGPWVAPLASAEEGDIQVNLAGSDNKRYLSMELVCEYDAYEQAYYEGRIADEHFTRSVRDALIDLAGSKSVSYLMDPTTHKVFLQEVRDVLQPMLFPVHIGETKGPMEVDPASGLRPGLSAFHTTFRGPLYEHVLVVDNAQRTLRIDDGPVTEYDGDEEDLAVHTDDGAVVFVDVTRLRPDFSGEVRVGVHGRVRRVLKERFLIQ